MMGALSFRPARLDDVPFVADVYTTTPGASPVDPEVMRYWRSRPERTYVERHFIVERDGRAIGAADLTHPRWDRVAVPHGTLDGELQPEHRDQATLAAVFREMEQRLVAEGAKRIGLRANDTDSERIAVIGRLGFREDRRAKRWELDLVANRERVRDMTAASRARMLREGIDILTLDRDEDPDRYRKLWRLNEEAVLDVPTTLPNVEETLEETIEWLASPDMHADRIWIARDRDAIVGMSALAYPPVRGIVGTAWTATGRAVRGRGVARALKCETLTQAIALGVDRVRTGNDAANDPILHINESMGYVPAIGNIKFLKEI